MGNKLFEEAWLQVSEDTKEKVSKYLDMLDNNLIPQFKIQEYTKQKLEYGKYLVIRKDGKVHFEVYNGTGWAYNENSITHFYLPKVK